MKRDIATGEFYAILRELDDDLKAVRLRDMPRNPERIGLWDRFDKLWW